MSYYYGEWIGDYYYSRILFDGDERTFNEIVVFLKQYLKLEQLIEENKLHEILIMELTKKKFNYYSHEIKGEIRIDFASNSPEDICTLLSESFPEIIFIEFVEHQDSNENRNTHSYNKYIFYNGKLIESRPIYVETISLIERMVEAHGCQKELGDFFMKDYTNLTIENIQFLNELPRYQLGYEIANEEIIRIIPNQQ
jgi:hypothetical protein